ncbi:MAG: elongation factor G [Patescibacteria group bacterium]
MPTKLDVEKEKLIPLSKIRNIGIIAHIDAGKTTTTETVLYLTGIIHKIGNIDEGTTQMDWMAQERERGITITSAATTCLWQPVDEPDLGPHRINIIDTPGHVDFTAEVERSLRVLDGAVVVFDGKCGVEPQSETVWRQADKYHVPRICYVNKLNLIGGDFVMSLNSIREKLGANAVAIQLPIGRESELRGYVDLVLLKSFVYGNENGSEVKVEEIPVEMKEQVEKYRDLLLEKAADFDQELMEKYLAGEPASTMTLRRALRAGTTSGKLFPVLGGDARKGLVRSILDAAVEYLPSPMDLPPVTGTSPKTGEAESRIADPDAPLAALAFKVQTDPYVGRLTYIRVYSGKLTAGTYVQNTRRDLKERLSRLLLMHANDREEVADLVAGEIGAAVGLKDTFTGDTLSDDGKPIILESIKFPEPVVSVAIEPKTKVDQEKMGLAIRKFAEEDPTFKVRTDQETGQVIISGMGELHLEIIVDRMRREFKVEANVGRPQVAYRETIRKLVEQEGKYVHQSGGRGQYGHVFLRLEPLPPGQGFEFENKIKGGSIPIEFVPAVEKGVREALDKGVLSGYPLTDLKITVFDGSYHDVDSSEMAFKIAASEATREGARRASPVFLEPIMKLEVTVPEEYMGEVIGDLSSRRATISGTESRGNVRAIDALVPLSEMFGYATSVRSLTQGRGVFAMEPSHYQEVPDNVGQKIIGAEAGR